MFRVASLALLFLAALTAFPARADYKLVSGPIDGDPMKVSIYQLANGLTVELTENHETPRFYAEIAVRAGSKNDPAESTGLAHYLEHLLFKGTEKMGTLDYEKEKAPLKKIEDLYEQHFKEKDPEKRKEIYAKINEAAKEAGQFAVPNEIDRLYKAMGGEDINAHTWHEETVYKVDLPANRVEQWAAIESERFRDPVFRLFPTELEAVYEEENRSLDNKQRLISEAVDKQLYKVHPYGQQPTLGLVEHLKNPSLKNIGVFYKTWYVPNNMSVFISGDINKDDTIKTIDKYFSSWERKDIPPQKKWEEKPLEGREKVEVQYEGEEYVLLAFRTVPNQHPDAEPLLLMDMILDNATAGLINLNLNQQQKVRNAGCSPQQNNDYGAQYFFGVPKEGQSLEDVERLLLEQIEHVKKGEFEDWIIPAIITDFKKTKKAGLESDEARVGEMRSAWIDYEPWEHEAHKIDRMEKLTKEDVVRVANKYFGKDYVVGFRRDAQHKVPNIQKPNLTKIDIDPQRQSEFAKQILAMPAKPIEPVFVDPSKDYKIITDAKGRKIYHAPDPINDLFSMTFNVEFGNFEDNTIGIAAQLLQKAGTEKLSNDDLQKEWYKLGTDFGIGTSDNETTISLSGLDENFDKSVGLLMDLLTHPRAPAETLEELKKIILVQRADAKKQAESIASALVQYNRYDKESSFLRMLPDAGVKALTEEQLFSIIKNLLDYKHIFTYSGSLPAEKVAEIINSHYPLKDTLKDVPPYRYLTARAPEKSEIYFFNKPGATATIRLEFGSTKYDESLTPAMQLFNSYFGGGMAGIVFQELREARALAYSAGAQYIPGYREKDQNLMIGAIQTQADKAPEALDAFKTLLDDLPVSEQRYEVARDAVISQYRTDKLTFRSVIGAVRTWERHGLAVDPRVHRYEMIQNAPFDVVTKFHTELIAQHPKLISIVGDKSKIDMDAVKKAGDVKEIGLEQIFVN